MKKIRLILAVLTSILPGSLLRSLIYRTVLGYKVVNSSIGFGTVICVDKAEIIKSRIGRFNWFYGPITVIIKENASIGSSNRFHCGAWASEGRFRDANYERFLEIGENTLITGNHYFDVTGSFVLGRNSWIAGIGSQFWTHGASVTDRNIRIGENCYIGSAVRFAPGAQIGSKVLVGLGSVVTKKIEKNCAIIGGVPAAVITENYDWKQRKYIS